MTCWTQSYTDRLLKMSTEKAEVTLGWHDGTTAAQSQISASPLPSVTHPSAPVSLFFCLGQCYTPFRSRFSPTFVTSLALLLLSLMILSLPVLLHYRSILSILQNLILFYLLLTLSLPSSSSAFPSSGSLLILLLSTHSFSVHILEDIYEHETERVHLHHFRRRGNLHFLLQPSPVSILFLI